MKTCTCDIEVCEPQELCSDCYSDYCDFMSAQATICDEESEPQDEEG